MAKEVENFEKYWKSVQPEIKTCTPTTGSKLKKEMLAWLDKTWEAEDKMADAVEAARMSGLTGKKPADFIKDGPFRDALKEWKDAVAKHHGNVSELTDFADRAKAVHDALEKECNDLEKALKKAGTGLSDVKIMAKLKEARRALPDLKKAAGKASGLPGHAVMYAVKLQRSVEVIISQRLKKIDPKELPKMLEEAGRKKTLKSIADLLRSVTTRCSAIQRGADKDPEKARKVLELARKELENLEELDDGCKSAAKKMKKEIAASKDKDKIQDVIDKAEKAMKAAGAAFKAAETKVEAATA